MVTTAQVIADAWNRAISLRSPQLSELLHTLGLTECTPLFPTPSGKFFLGNNFVAITRPGTLAANGAPVLGIQWVWRPSYYGGPQAKRFAQMPTFSVLGCNFPCSAQRMLENVRTLSPTASLELQTGKDEWDLYYGRALGFHFVAARPGDGDPAASEFSAMDFNFILPYDGSIQPRITLEADI